MFSVKALDCDARLQAYCITAKCTYRWFLEKTTGAEANLEIQRAVIKDLKSYATLREDLKRGCVLPPIVLATKNVDIAPLGARPFQKITDAHEEETILRQVQNPLHTISPDQLYIIDGLQRTNAIKSTLASLDDDAERNSFLENQLRIELWLNIPFGAIAYRMLLLNAGQKPMSMRHQVEILSVKLKEELSTIPNIDIFTSSDERRRTQPGQYQLSKLAQGFQAWLQGSPNLDIRNSVMEQLLSESAIETLSSAIGGVDDTQESFRKFMEWFVKADHLTNRLPADVFGNETFILGLCAAVGAAERNPNLHERMTSGLELLISQLEENPGADILGIAQFEELRAGLDAKKVNIGAGTREMVFRAFQEYFLSAGTKSMTNCWIFSGSV
jgi:hypothetical protein